MRRFPLRPPADYRAAPGAPGRLFESPDGRRAVDAQLHLQGARDLHAAVVRAGQLLARNPRLRELALVARLPRFSRERIRGEWAAVRSLLRGPLAARMKLIVLGDGEPWSIPEDGRLKRIGAHFEPRKGRGDESALGTPGAAPSRKFFDVFTVLLDRWLRGLGSIASRELMQRSGASFPTVAEAVRRMEERREIVRRSKRSLELATFPGRTWAEVLPLAPSFRKSVSFVDASGRAPDAVGLLRRLSAASGRRLAVGGVIAARHWDPGFDLHGVPRLDLTAHVGPTDGTDLVAKLSRGLKTAPAGIENAVMVVHVVARPDAGFEPSGKGLPWAPPVEVLFDLQELRLVDQAQQLVERLRRRKRP